MHVWVAKGKIEVRIQTECVPLENGVQYKGMCPFKDWQVDFTQMPKTKGNFKFWGSLWILFLDL